MITPEEKMIFFKAMGNKKGEAIFKVIDEIRPFIETLEDENVKSHIQEDIGDLITVMGSIFNSLLRDGNVPPLDIALLKVLWGRLQRKSNDINNYEESVQQVKNAKHAADTFKKRMSA